MNGRPEEGATDEPTELRGELWQVRPVGQAWGGKSSSFLYSSSGRIGFSPDASRLVYGVRASESAGFVSPPSAGIPSGCGGQSIPSDRPSAGWVKARQRSAASSPEHSDRRERPRSGEGGRERGFRFVEFAPEADVCGATGCVESGGLMVVEMGHKRRTLCADHARGWSA
jgi:hypothetical protein